MSAGDGQEPAPDGFEIDWNLAAGVPRWKTRQEADAALREALAELRGDMPGRMAVETRLKAAYAKAAAFDREGRRWHAWILRSHAHRMVGRLKRGQVP